jgi:hypothetical protein
MEAQSSSSQERPFGGSYFTQWNWIYTPEPSLLPIFETFQELKKGNRSHEPTFGLILCSISMLAYYGISLAGD